MASRRNWVVTGFGIIAVVAVLAGLATAGAGAGQQSSLALPRDATLYTSGTAWGPFTQFNPLRSSGNATGTLGLLYETLFRYDPLADKYIPWLATSGKWVGRTYVIQLRSGVKWSDGKPLTGNDVKFTFETGKLAGSELSTMWKTGLTNIAVKGNTVSFVFKGKPNYLDWNTNIYSWGIVPQHLWNNYSPTEITTGNTDKYMVGTGPFVYGAGKGTSGTLQWNRRSNWWATKALGKKMPMQYLVDIHNTQNTASLQNFLKNDIDLSNNFFPGVDKSIGGKVQTYYAKAPYMLSANTAWLVPNTTHAPLNDAAFRRALAMSINIDQIVKADYGNIVAKADPTGLLPTWNKWIDKAQSNKLGFKYNIAGAKSLLAANGYKDTNGDGYVENKDGSPISLSIVCPNGWSDWMTSIQVIADSAKEAGIKITPSYPEYGTMADDRGHGNFDLLLGNDRQYSNTPWTYYQYIYQLPISKNQTTVNYERFEDQSAWNLTQALDKTPTTNTVAYQAVMSKLETTFLKSLPAIPLWYNGMWSMVNTQYWTNWPSSGGPKYTPSSWRNFWQMTSIDMLTHLKPAGT
jgi:peptide/nickel transport system substrate-binding protein